MAALATADWQIVAKDLVTTAIGIAFTNANEGFLAGSGNGVGPVIFKTVDGGNNWKAANASFGADALLLSASAVDNTVVVGAIFGELYSDDDGNTFEKSLGGGLSQSIRFIGKDGDGGKQFGAAGSYLGKQGVAITTDGGKFFHTVAAPALKTAARYACYPSADVWYISAGQWPSQTPSEPLRRTEYMDKTGRISTDFNNKQNVGVDGYMGQIVKTTDGGNTWTSLLFVNNTVYFNGIDCSPSDPNHCCAVAETSDGPQAGAYIYCTTDGQNFKQTLAMPNTNVIHYSLIDLRFADDQTVWAAGGKLNAVAPNAWFVKSTDGGKTWDTTSHTLSGYYAMALEVVSTSVAYASVDNLVTQESGVAKYTA
jgi:photosystem II stability/assembly factor-like uncharacterized protein